MGISGAGGGATFTGPTSWSPTIQGFGTVSSLNAYYTVTAGKVLSGFVCFTAGTTTSSLAQITLPSGFTPNAVYTGSTQVGQGAVNKSAGFPWIVTVISGLASLSLGAVGTGNNAWAQTGSQLSNSGDQISINFELYI